MPGKSTEFSREQQRVLARIQADYDTWLAAEQAVMALPYGLKWKRIAGREYLYEIADRRGNGRSLGRRTPETEARFAQFQQQKAAATAARDAAAARLTEAGREYRAQRLPLISSEAARLLREADRRGLLGPQLLVVSDTAVAAMEVEAAGGLSLAREDLHQLELLALPTAEPHLAGAVQSMLRSLGWEPANGRYAAVSARNSSGYEVAVTMLAGAGRARGWAADLDEADRRWLLAGTPAVHVVAARDGSVARVATLDPRRLALFRLWRAERARGSARERATDLRIAGGLLEAFALDPAFEAALPSTFAGLHAGWRTGALESGAEAQPASAPGEGARGRSRLSASDRQSSIVDAAVTVFAEQGFSAATTQQIAAAANVSSALLYRHFPSKRALYRAVLRKLIRDQNFNHERIQGPEPSTRGIVSMLDDFMRQNVGLTHDPRDLAGRRVLFASLAGDGSYAQLVFRRALRLRRRVLEQALAAARASGDITGPAVEPANGFFFIDHIGETLGIAYRNRAQSLIPYEGGPEILVRDAVRFCARGLGIADSAVAAYYAARDAR